MNTKFSGTHYIYNQHLSIDRLLDKVEKNPSLKREDLVLSSMFRNNRVYNFDTEASKDQFIHDIIREAAIEENIAVKKIHVYFPTPEDTPLVEFMEAPDKLLIKNVPISKRPLAWLKHKLNLI